MRLAPVVPCTRIDPDARGAPRRRQRSHDARRARRSMRAVAILRCARSTRTRRRRSSAPDFSAAERACTCRRSACAAHRGRSPRGRSPSAPTRRHGRRLPSSGQRKLALWPSTAATLSRRRAVRREPRATTRTTTARTIYGQIGGRLPRRARYPGGKWRVIALRARGDRVVRRQPVRAARGARRAMIRTHRPGRHPTIASSPMKSRGSHSTGCALLALMRTKSGCAGDQDVCVRARHGRRHQQDRGATLQVPRVADPTGCLDVGPVPTSEVVSSSIATPGGIVMVAKRRSRGRVRCLRTGISSIAPENVSDAYTTGLPSEFQRPGIDPRRLPEDREQVCRSGRRGAGGHAGMPCANHRTDSASSAPSSVVAAREATRRSARDADGHQPFVCVAGVAPDEPAVAIRRKSSRATRSLACAPSRRRLRASVAFRDDAVEAPWFATIRDHAFDASFPSAAAAAPAVTRSINSAVDRM